jgi:hypothetical protein
VVLAAVHDVHPVAGQQVADVFSQGVAGCLLRIDVVLPVYPFDLEVDFASDITVSSRLKVPSENRGHRLNASADVTLL